MELMMMMMSSQSPVITTLKSSLRIITSKHHKVQLLAHLWKAQMKKMILKGQNSTMENLVHLVKEGETLTCISKMYGVSIYEIAAANRDIIDLDLVFHGQRLSIPSSLTSQILMTQPGDRQPKINLFKRNQSSVSGNKDPRVKTFSSLSCRHLLYARTTGYFLVLVPLIAFCIRCITGALYSKISGALEHRAANESKKLQAKPKSVRWKVALSDLNPEARDTESRPEYDQHEDEDALHFEDLSNSHIDLERDYQKFLSECGMSKRGYWRGGST